MTITELVIVYTSCGAPFAVERLLSDTRPSRTPVALDSILHLGFWPAFLLVRMLRVIETVFVSQKDSKNAEKVDKSVAEAHAAQQELVISLVDSGAGRSALRVTDLLDRYAGLASLLRLSQREMLYHDSEIARISDHPSPTIAAACRNRRNIALIEKHLVAARREFLELLTNAMPASPNDDSPVSSALDFVGHVDPAAAEQIQQLIEIASPSKVKSTLTGHNRYERTNATS